MEFHPIQRIKEHLQRLKKDMEPMSFREKLDHLWTYYKWVLVVLAVIGVLISVVSSSIANINRETLISGMLINTDVSLEGNSYLTDDYFAMLQGVEGKQEIELVHLNFMPVDQTQDIDYTYNAVLRIVANVSAQQLDYVITDEVGLEVCLNQDVLMDLRELLTEEELALLEEDLIYLHYEEDNVTVPVAVNLRDQKFSNMYIQSEHEHYLAFIANTPRKEACRDFWEYLQQAGQVE